MSFLRALRRPPRLEIRCLPRRCYATEAKAAEEPEVVVAKSSCPENTILTGVNYLKGQQPVLALADDQYPPWLWTLLQPKVLVDDGPGGKAEKYRLRKANRQRIREQNFMKTQ